MASTKAARRHHFAYFMREVASGPHGHQALYHLDVPLGGHSYVIVSSMTDRGRSEVAAFPSNRRGDFLSYTSLIGPIRGETDHAVALSEAGYTVRPFGGGIKPDPKRGHAKGRAKAPVMSGDPFRPFVIPLSRAQSDLIATEILERYNDEMEDRGDFRLAAHLVKEEFLRSGGKNLVAAPFVKEMLIDFSNGLDESISRKRTIEEHGLNGQQALAMQRTAVSLINKLPFTR